jgi:hypothetical protein
MDKTKNKCGNESSLTFIISLSVLEKDWNNDYDDGWDSIIT